MADYSDAYDDVRERVRCTIEARLRAEGFGAKFDFGGWATDHIRYLECLWCGVLVSDSRLHRKDCIAPLAADPDIEPPPLAPDLT